MKCTESPEKLKLPDVAFDVPLQIFRSVHWWAANRIAFLSNISLMCGSFLNTIKKLVIIFGEITYACMLACLTTSHSNHTKACLVSVIWKDCIQGYNQPYMMHLEIHQWNYWSLTPYHLEAQAHLGHRDSLQLYTCQVSRQNVFVSFKLIITSNHNEKAST